MRGVEMKKFKIVKRFVMGAATCVLAICFLAGLHLLTVVPKSPVGLWLFRHTYEGSSDKAVVLRGLSDNLGAHHGGYIPSRLDAFFESRLATTHSSAEFNDVVDFYAFKAGGREGQRVFIWPSRVKEKAMASIISRLDNYSADEAASALVLVEDMRQGKDDNLFKAHLFTDEPMKTNYSLWLQQKGVPEAKARYRKWWNSYATWEEKVKHDPLANSYLHIEGI